MPAHPAHRSVRGIVIRSASEVHSWSEPEQIGFGLLLYGVWDLLHHKRWLELKTA